MSNTMVGTVYEKIMSEVIENCIVTFEEDGVERKLLDEVKRTWQQKLSDRKVAQMPWDPAPPAPAPANSAAQAQAKAPPAAASAAASKASAAQNGGAGGPAIKTEQDASGGGGGGGYDLQNLHKSNGVPTHYNEGFAEYRAQQNLQDKFGHAASAQVNQLQAQAGYPAAASAGATPQQADYQRRMAELAKQKAASLGNAQTDGATDDDWQALVAERRAAAADGGAVEADALLRERIEAVARDMEGGGVMVPLSRARARAERRARRGGPVAVGEGAAAGQYDGAGDEDDEDAINSDLDDPEDKLPDDEEDEANGEIMLCTYEKVQRVKNKWKCTLKDGILTTGNKEYVFNKATGEFEW